MGATFLEAEVSARLNMKIEPVTPEQAAAAERLIRSRLASDDAAEVLAMLNLGGHAVNTTPIIELVQDTPEERVAVLYVAGVSVALGPDELHDLAKDARRAHRVLANQEARDMWVADIERQLAVFGAAFIVADEGVTAEAIHRRLFRAGRHDLAAKFWPLAREEQATRRKREKGVTGS